MTANQRDEAKVTVEMGSGSAGVDVARNIAAGNIPSNDVMLGSISAAQKTIDQRGQHLNEQGQTLAEDAQKVLEATKKLIEEKNSDGKLQEVLQQTKTAAQTGAQSGQKSNVQNQAGVVGSDLTQAARELATLLGQSTEMRGILLDQFKTFRKLFWKRMQSQGQGQGQSQSQGQSQATQGQFSDNNFPSSSSFNPASSTVYTEVFTTTGSSSSSPFSQQIGGNSSLGSSYGTAVQQPQQFSTNNSGFDVISTPLAQVPGQIGTTTSPSFPQQQLGGTTPSFGQQIGSPSSLQSPFEPTPSTSGFSNKSNFDDFQKISLTSEEKRELIYSWRNLLTQLGSKQNYGTAMNQIFVLFDHLGDLKNTTTSDPNAQRAAQQGNEALSGVKELAERFMGDKTLDNLINLFRELNDFTDRNPDLRRFGSDWRNFATETMKEPKLLNDQKYSTRMEELVDRTVDWMNDRYVRSQTNAIADEIRDLFNAVKEDSTLSEVQDTFSKLFKDLVMDQNGTVSIGQLTSSIPQLKNLLAPILIQQFSTIPIKRVSGTTPKYDFELANIILNVSDLLPDKFEFDIHTKGKVGLSSGNADQMRTKLRLRISNMTVSMKNVNFWYLRKKMPKIEDEGVVNVSVLEPGASIKIVWEIMTSEKQPIALKHTRSTCDIGNLKVDIVQAKHSVIDKIGTKLFGGAIKQRIETAVCEGLGDMGNGLADRMNRAVRGKPQPKSNVKVGVDPKSGSATISNTQNTTPATSTIGGTGSDKLY